MGLMLAVVTIFILEMFGHYMYPPPIDLDPQIPEDRAKIIEQAPVAALLMVVLAYAVGSFIGGLIANAIGRHPKLFDSLITGIILTVFGVANMLEIPHPMWMMILSIVCFIPCAYFGGRIIKRKTPE